MKRTFGNRLENIMKKQRITAKELALKAGQHLGYFLTFFNLGIDFYLI